ncbi:ribonuclease Z [Sphingobacteriales bacterium UPWRP_1]|nr:ribonuclease Z [Sphingobacteriales bacterium TSM_CSM]PSJ76081.1 ribonuclease Z [Sphingobacteriales bacterium UPWRP_1]
MSFRVTILGSNSAMPANGRHPSAQAVVINENPYLVDCGEGTQMQLMHYKVKTARIDHIFISHLHGDHYLGLLPLIDSYVLTNRTKPLHIFAPQPLQEVVAAHHKASTQRLEIPFKLFFYATNPHQTGVIFENNDVCVSTLPMKHGLECTGFLFRQKQVLRNMIAEKIQQYQIPFTAIPAIKKGADFVTMQGAVIANSELTYLPPAGSYAYCSDTAYNEDLVPHIAGVDVLYHESTYLSDLQELAAERGHSTAIDAARIAHAAGAGRLYLGHFSSRYKKLDKYLHEAHPFFAQTYLATEGLAIDVVPEKHAK